MWSEIGCTRTAIETKIVSTMNIAYPVIYYKKWQPSKLSILDLIVWILNTSIMFWRVNRYHHLLNIGISIMRNLLWAYFVDKFTIMMRVSNASFLNIERCSGLLLLFASVLPEQLFICFRTFSRPTCKCLFFSPCPNKRLHDRALLFFITNIFVHLLIT